MRKEGSVQYFILTLHSNIPVSINAQLEKCEKRPLNVIMQSKRSIAPNSNCSLVSRHKIPLLCYHNLMPFSALTSSLRRKATGPSHAAFVLEIGPQSPFPFWSILLVLHCSSADTVTSKYYAGCCSHKTMF